MSQPLKTFICYAHEDHEIVEGLKKQLAIFEKRGLLQIWSDGKILAGEHWDKSIKSQLELAEIVLLFISVDFINSDYIEKTELQAALLRHRNGEATLIPIIVRHCHWEEYFDIGQFQALPAKAHPILSGHFPHRDEAFFEIAAGVRKKAEELREQKIANLEAEAQKAKEAALRVEAEATAKREAEAKAAQLAATAKLHRSKDEASWKAAFDLNTLEAYEDYLEKYTLHEAEAHERIGKLEEIEAKIRAKQKANEKAAKKAEEEKRALLAAEAQRKKVAALKNAREAKILKKRADDEANKKKREAEAAAKALAAKEADPFADLMIPIKGGTFDMGDTFGDGDPSEKPIHKVTLNDFYLCKYPVTQAHWKAIMGDNPSHFKGDDLPVEQVNWDDAQNFIQKLNEKTGKKYRLPTEAEWEYAARDGGQKVRFGNGKDIADPKEMNFDATKDYQQPYSIIGEFRGKTTPVSQFKPNPLGLHDMSGNVWEWCQDVWHEDYKGAPDDGSAWEHGGNISLRVLRGGSWNSLPEICRAANRYVFNPSYRDYYVGFRVVRSY